MCYIETFYTIETHKKYFHDSLKHNVKSYRDFNEFKGKSNCREFNNITLSVYRVSEGKTSGGRFNKVVDRFCERFIM